MPNPFQSPASIAILLILLVLLLTPTLQAQQMPGMNMPATTPSEPTLPTLTAPTDLLTEARHRSPLTLNDLLTRALASNPTLDQTRSNTRRAQALARQSSLFPNPTLGYQGDQIRGGSFGGGEQGGFLAQTIPLGGKLSLRRKAFDAEAQSTALSTVTQTRRIQADVTQAFYSTLAAQESLQIHRDLLSLAEDAVQTAHQLANVGQAETPDVLSTEITHEHAELADEQAQRTFLARFEILATLTGDPTLQPSTLTGDLASQPALDPDTILDQILQQSPLIHEAQANLTSAEARLASARRDVVPDLQLKAGVQNNLEQLGNTSQPKQVGPQAFASAAISIPLWNRNQGNIAAAAEDVENARQELHRLQLTLRQQAQPILQTYLTASAAAARYRTTILPRANRATQLYQQKYDQMAQAYTPVLASRRTSLELQLQYIETLATVQRAATALTYGTLTGALSSQAPTSPSSMPQITPAIE